MKIIIEKHLENNRHPYEGFFLRFISEAGYIAEVSQPLTLNHIKNISKAFGCSINQIKEALIQIEIY